MPKKKQATLTLYEPYAQFIAWGIKRFETRSWFPHSLSPNSILLIHAAKRKPQSFEKRLITHPSIADVLLKHNCGGLNDMPYGAIVCAVRYKMAFSTNEFTPDDEIERLVGNYSENRWAWELEVFKVAEPPLSVSGKQGLWFYEWE